MQNMRVQDLRAAALRQRISYKRATACFVFFISCLEIRNCCLARSFSHEARQAAAVLSAGNTGRGLRGERKAFVSNGYEFIRALIDTEVENIYLISQVVDVPQHAWHAAVTTLPILISRNLTVEGDPGLWTLLRLHFSKNAVRLLGGLIWTFRYILLDGAYNENLTRQTGFDLLEPSLPGLHSYLVMEDCAIFTRLCFPPKYQQTNAQALARPPEFPGKQAVVFNPPTDGCVNGSHVPPLDRCWALRVDVLDVAGMGVALDGSDNPHPMNVMFWMRAVRAYCKEFVDVNCLEAGTSPLVCYIQAAARYKSNTSSPLDDYEPPPPQKQQGASPSPPPPSSSPSQAGQQPRGASPGAEAGGGEGASADGGFGALGGAIVGAVAGAIVIMGALLAAAWALLVKRRRAMRSRGSPYSGPGTDEAAPTPAKSAVMATPSSGFAGDSSGSADLQFTGSQGQLELRLDRLAVGATLSSEAELHDTSEAVTAVAPRSLSVGPVTQGTRPRPSLELRVVLVGDAAGGGGGDGGGGDPAAAAAVDAVRKPSDRQATSDGDADVEAGSMDSDGGSSSSNPLAVTLLPVVRGKGSFGRVVEGLYRGQRVAVKILKGREGGDGGGGAPYDLSVTSFAQEVQVLGRCQHPNIVRLLAACVEPPRLCLVMELMDCSLEWLLHGGPSRARMPLCKVLHITICIASALAYLHPTIVHRDLKPGNVLVHDPCSDRPQVKLTDFGLARLRTTAAPTEHPDAGTPAYMAPECFDLQLKLVTHKADMYSLGVLLWEMLTGARPWGGVKPLAVAFMVFARRARPPLRGLDTDCCPRKLTRLLKGCWEEDPERRPAAAEAVKELTLILQEHQQQQKNKVDE